MASVKELFRIPSSSQGAPQTTTQALAIANRENTDELRQGETYVNYGKRVCGLVNGSEAALTPFLHKVYMNEKRRQLDDERLQDELKLQFQESIAQLKTGVRQMEVEKSSVEQYMDDSRRRVDCLEKDIARLKDQVPEKRTARVKMWLGLVVLVPMTFYLFIFYSSTFYSAFFSDGREALSDGLSTAMFNPKAIPAAWQHLVDGEGNEFAFIILAPVIFLGLGFSLHFIFAKKGWMAVLKSACLVLVTFLFDCILAYKIGEQLYNSWVDTQLGDYPPYSIPHAITDVNTWAVIFCGFIAYIIWGIVFDLAYTAYEDSVSSKRQIEALQSEIGREERLLQALRQRSSALSSAIVQGEGEIDSQTQELSRKQILRPDLIKSCMIDFFTGWISLMNAMNRSAEDQQSARDQYDRVMTAFFPQ